MNINSLFRKLHGVVLDRFSTRGFHLMVSCFGYNMQKMVWRHHCYKGLAPYNKKKKEDDSTLNNSHAGKNFMNVIV